MAQQWDPELLAGFFEEASEDVEQLEARLVALKSNPNDEAAIGQAFRTIHSIKGNTGFFGIKNANHFCDRFENLLDHLRSAIGDVTTATVDLLLRGLDEIRAMLAEAEAGKRSSELTEVQERILEEVATHCVEETIVVSAGLVRELAAMIKSEPFVAAVEANAQLADIRTALETLAKSVEVDCEAAATDQSHDADRLAEAQWGEADVSAGATAVDHWLALCEKGEESPVPTEAFGQLLAAAPGGDGDEGTTVLQELVDEANILAERGLATDEILISVLRDKFEALVLRFTTSSGDQDAPAAEEGGAAATAESAPKEADSANHQAAKKSSIRVSQEKIDEFLEHVGDLIITSKNYLVIEKRLNDTAATAAIGQELKAINHRFSGISHELQRSVLALRKVPVNTLLRTVPRMASDLAEKLGKKVEVVIVGDEETADRSTLDLLKDPLTHILRNSLDHGLEGPEDRVAAGKPETGTITITVTVDKEFFTLVIADDGRGIDLDRVREKAVETGVITAAEAATISHDDNCGLIFSAGLSTAKEQTDVSGRGVGMDVVMRHVSESGGNVHVTSRAGVGTTVTIRIPVSGTLMVIGAMMVKIAGLEYFIPTADIHSLVRPGNLKPHRTPDGAEVAPLRGAV
ncbi:MAG: Hpt domain-containing protein [Planctomycetes bacterium]|nr:Hpt domain-containing protein [Planctomycetota bacterium]